MELLTRPARQDTLDFASALEQMASTPAPTFAADGFTPVGVQPPF